MAAVEVVGGGGGGRKGGGGEGGGGRGGGGGDGGGGEGGGGLGGGGANEMKKDPLMCAVGKPLALVNSAVPLSTVVPTAKPHSVMEHAAPLHMSALTNAHAREAAPEGTLVDINVRAVMLELNPLTVAHVVAVLPVQ
ncbi:hypothetical protein CYMTET_29470 [Cymbomonas tetramitiformis]|uniref:Uncharacterized protein n=1 Tax=Cymbomonas tetramitiformis TaxID=36881 RepID=A0AAE0FKZ7_9CHLO|nr:hypothetical protein CYMTET_29470 [Cymbomonas tetramitiformis]